MIEGITLHKLATFVIGVYGCIVIVRAIFAVTKADFYNPVTQLVFRITEPLVALVRSVVPPAGSIDLAPWVLVWILHAFEPASVYILSAGPINTDLIYVVGLTTFIAVDSVIWVYMMIILVWAIMGWIAVTPFGTRSYIQSFCSLLNSATTRVLRPIRSRVPALGSLDFSPVILFIALSVLREFVHYLMGLLPSASPWN